MSNDRPLFTIAIPTFNRATWVRACVASALGQTVDSFEVVVSNNASTDETADVLKECADKRLIVITQAENIGPVRNWNACLAAAKGTYVVFVSDDDSVASHLLERCAAIVKSDDTELPVIVGLGDVCEPQIGVTRQAIQSRRLNSGVCDGTDILLEFLRGQITPQMCTVVMRTETLRARGGFPAGWPHTGDLVSWVPMLLDGKAGFINESCGTYCSHEATQTAKFSVHTRLKDIDRLASVIVAEAERKVSVPHLLQTIKKEAARYVAGNFVGHIGMERKKGLSRKDVAVVAWEWRSRLCRAGIAADSVSLVRTLTLFLLPLPVTRRISKLKGTLRKFTAHVS